MPSCLLRRDDSFALRMRHPLSLHDPCTTGGFHLVLTPGEEIEESQACCTTRSDSSGSRQATGFMDQRCCLDARAAMFAAEVSEHKPAKLQ
jgi:hypothetical protein